MFTQNITSTKMSLFTGNHVEKNRRCCDSMRCCTIATMDYGTDPISSFELHNNNWASGSKHPGPSECDVYSDVIQEAQSNDLLHTARLLMRLDTPLHENNARGTKYAVYCASVVAHTVFENKKMAALTCFGIKKAQLRPLLLYSLAWCLFFW